VVFLEVSTLGRTGTLVYVSGAVRSPQSKLVWVNRNGTEEPLASPAHPYSMPRISPDGRKVAVALEEKDSQTWHYDFSRKTLTRFTFEGTVNISSIWTPDSKRLVFNSNRGGAANIFWQFADGSGGLERLTTSENLQAPTSWSGDGQLLAFHEINSNTQREIWVLRISDRKAQPFLRTLFDEGGPQFSRDGRWLAYISNESGRYEIYVQAYPGPGGKYQISTEGGTEPLWNPNGRELFYRSGDKMMVVDITTQPSFTAGAPRMLLRDRTNRLNSQFPTTMFHPTASAS
jgi:eukaryotic-like serine/threonine-protein kinase